MSMIPIHKDRGLDPHLCYCPRCGGETNSLTIGELRKCELSNGQTTYANRGQTSKAMKDIEKAGLHRVGNWEEVGEHEKVPGDICEKCEAEMLAFHEEVAKGGIYWKCKSCHMEGVIKAGVPICEAVKKDLGVEMDQPAGIEFDKCEEHGGGKDEPVEV